MLLNNHHHFTMQRAGIALVVLLGAALSLPAQATEVWRVNMARSAFSPGPNTLVLERSSAKEASDAAESNGTQAAKRFLVISRGKVYIVTNAAAFAKVGKDIRPVADYTAGKGLDILQIGENARIADHCGFRCQGGLPEKVMTVTFKAKGANPQETMGTGVVLNTR